MYQQVGKWSSIWASLFASKDARLDRRVSSERHLNSREKHTSNKHPKKPGVVTRVQSEEVISCYQRQSEVIPLCR
jgi:hypothetical protein